MRWLRAADFVAAFRGSLRYYERNAFAGWCWVTASKCLVLGCVLAVLAGVGCTSANDVPRPNGAAGNGGTGGSGGTSGEGGSGTGGASGEGGDSGEGGSGTGGASGEGGDSGEGGGGERVFDAGSEPDRNDVSAGELCDRLSTIQCAGEAYCCDNPGRDFAACKQTAQSGCQDQLMFDAIASSEKVAFNEEHASLAYGEIERRASQCDPSVAEFGQSVDGLRGMFKGTVPPGGSCITLNLTRRDEVAKALASCLDPANNACLPESAIGWACRPRADVGGPCFTDVNCKDGLYCPNPDFEIGMTSCAARKPVDAACSLPNECETLFCKGGKCVAETDQAAYCLTN